MKADKVAMWNALVFNSSGCEHEWRLLLGERLGCYYLPWHAGAVTNSNGSFVSYEYVRDIAGRPRVLILGDSISRGVTESMHTDKRWMRRINLHEAPENCGGFAEYWHGLSTWLGSCAWDLIQFNVGAHVGKQGTGDLGAYARDLKRVIGKVRQHSPQARVVIAATTPSPFDSEATRPTKSNCSRITAYPTNYGWLHVAGAVSTLNRVAKQVADQLSVLYNDRYAVIHPNISSLQRTCDIHFLKEGYSLLASHDSRFLAAALGLKEL